MKKLALVVGSLLSSFELLAGNFVPVCLNVGDDQKASVYKAIVENSFVTQLDSERAAKLSEEDKNEIINDESGFLKKKIQSVDPSAKVAFIPKSLYQLNIFKLFLEEINKGRTIKECKKNFKTGIWSYDADDGIILDGESYGPENNSCDDYMNRKIVQSYFWKINDSILPCLGGISAEEMSKEINIRNVTRNLMKDLPSKFGDIQKIHYDSGISTLLSFLRNEEEKGKSSLKAENSKIVEDLIVEESKAPENTYRIYTGELAEQDILKGRVDNHSSSFSDGMFSGIVSEPGKAMAFGYALNLKHMKSIDLPKGGLLNARTDSFGVETSGLSVHIPPVICMGATLGYGEYFHVRSKVKSDTLESEFSDIHEIYGIASRKETPWYVTYSSPVENFWGRLELSSEKTYKLSNKKDLNVKTYKWNSRK